MAGSALTPALALDYLGELSTDIEAIVVLDGDGRVAAATGDDADRNERMRELFTALLDRAAETLPGAGVDQLEVTTAEGSVFAVRGHDWTVGAVAGRKPLASLMFYDLRNVVADLGDGRAAPAEVNPPGAGLVPGDTGGTAPTDADATTGNPPGAGPNPADPSGAAPGDADPPDPARPGGAS